MATALFNYLSVPERERASSLPLFTDEARLARKPRCGDSKGFSHIRTACHALTHRYIQPNSPVAYSRLVFDLDWHQNNHRLRHLPLRYLADTNAWENDLGLPTPSWAAISLDKNSAHLCYELATPVGRHPTARMKPQRYLAAIESALGEKLMADAGYSGALCKNPLNSAWFLYRGQEQAFELHDLAEYVALKATGFQKYSRTPRGEVGRNVYLFDLLRFWAYDHIAHYRSRGIESWIQQVVATAEQFNSVGYSELPYIVDRGLLPLSECKRIAKSVANWTWINHGSHVLTREFSELQSWRGKRGAKESAFVKRVNREEQITEAIEMLKNQGQIPTMGKVAEIAGCSKQALSKSYKQFFQGTTQ